jgi:N-acetylneuraminate lyase
MKFGKGKLERIIIHCGAESLEQSKDLARHAESIGADAIAAICPSFFRPANEDSIVRYLKPIAASAPKLPFLYYHFPAMTGVGGSVETILSKGKKDIPNLVGAKFTAFELCDAMASSYINDREFEIFLGFDSVNLAGMALGMPSSVGLSWSLMGRFWHRMHKAFQAGNMDTAREEQLRINQMAKLITQNDKHHFISSHKAAMRVFGLEFGPARLPVAPISKSESSEILKALEEAEFLKYAT